MREIYVVLCEDEDGTNVEGVYAEKEMAEEIVSDHEDDDWQRFYYEECKIIEKRKNKRKLYYVEMCKEGEPKISVGAIEDAPTEVGVYGPELDRFHEKLKLTVVITAQTKEEAINIALKKRAEIIEAGNWCYRE